MHAIGCRCCGNGASERGRKMRGPNDFLAGAGAKFEVTPLMKTLLCTYGTHNLQRTTHNL